MRARRSSAWIGLSSLLFGLAAAIALPPRPSDAQPVPVAPAAGTGAATAAGAFVTSVSLDVPEFRGLEPDLGLTYDSGTGDGFAGVGWTLTGVSLIERVGTNRGAPRYDATDVFLLDGDELVPGCTALGGTYCARQQDFRRIVRNGFADTWDVWDADGTRSTYAPVYTTAGGTFRWALTREQDTHGNAVTYSYWRQAPGNAYLDSVSYNGTSIKLHRESRPDPTSFANGDTVGVTNMRLKTVDITVGGQRFAIYRLSYAQAASTQRSVLTAVQRYGRDAVVDASGTVTGGAALPAVTMTYSPGEARLPAQTWNSSVGAWNPIFHDMFGDVDGDGKTDFVRVWKSGTDAKAQVNLSNGTGYPTQSSNVVVGGWNDATKDYLADVNGDGRADLIRLWQNGTSTYAQVNPSNGSGYPTATGNTSVGDWNPPYRRDFFADVNGDYKADFVRVWKNGTDAYAQVNLSNGLDFAGQDSNVGIGGWNDATRDYLADVSGDGRADLIRLWQNGTSTYAQVNPSDGSGYPTATGNTSVGDWNPAYRKDFITDVNNDGKADFIRIWKDGTDAKAQVNLSAGYRFAGQDSNVRVGGWNDATADYLADVNGDDRADLIRVWKNGTAAYAQINPYDGKDYASVASNASIGGWDSDWKTYLADVSGDGKADAVRLWQSGTNTNAQVNKASGPMPDLLTSMSNGIGGGVSVQYVPSSQWWSAGHSTPSAFPTVSAVTTTDGRGTSFTTSYSFADPLWARQPTERRFLGFGSSKEVMDAAGTYRETFYQQTLASAGAISRSYLRNTAGQIYDYEQYTYTETSTPPYTSLLSSHSTGECNLSAVCRQSRTDYTYDGYGNVTLEQDRGDIARSGDELTTATTYAANTAAFIVDRPSSETSYAGIGTAGLQLTRTVHFYDGATTSSTPPAKGDETRQDDWNSDTGGQVSATSTFDTWGNVVSSTDARGSTSTTTFDPTYHLFPIHACDALSHCTDTTWDPVLGQATATTDPNDATNQQAYDTLGRQVSATDPAGNTTTWQYFDVGDPNRQRIRMTTPDGSADGLWAETYADGLGRTYQTVKEGAAAGVTYVQGRVYFSTTALVWKESLWRESGQPARYTVFGYDGAERITRTTHPDGSVATVAYGMGSDGLPSVTSQDELGHETTTWSDVDGQLTTVREKNGAAYYTTTYAHDPLGRLTAWTDAAGVSSTVVYNSLGWKTAMTDMDTGTWTYAYDDGGLLTRQTDAKNQTVSFGYDALGRPTSRTDPGNQLSQWFYDEAGHGASIGRLTTTTYPAGSDSHTWDSRGEETAVTQCIGAVCKTMANEYDSAGRLATVTYPDGESVGYTYNSAGRPATVAGYVTSMVWDAAGQLTNLSYANGTSTTYAYDPDRQSLTSASVTAGNTTLYQASYAYNAAGLVTSMTQGTPTPVATTTYTYDDLDRLLSVGGSQSQTFTYSPTGNITSNSAVGAYSYLDPAHKHAVTAAGSATYAYDSNGNMTSGGDRTMTWDGANRLTSVTVAGTTTSFTYDAGQRRLTKVSGGTTTRYFGSQVEEVNGALVKYYYAGPILVARSAGGVKTWYHADRLGSTRLITGPTGAEVRDYDYRPFGAPSGTGTAANERTFTGHIQDAESGLTYMVARYQDPVLGRFVSPDSVIPALDNPQDLNRYSYVHNNPVNNVDPTGQAPLDCDAACIRSYAKHQNKAAQRRAAATRGTSTCLEAHACNTRGPAYRAPVHPGTRRAPVHSATRRAPVHSEKLCERGIRCTGTTRRPVDVSRPALPIPGPPLPGRDYSLVEAVYNVHQGTVTINVPVPHAYGWGPTPNCVPTPEGICFVAHTEGSLYWDKTQLVFPASIAEVTGIIRTRTGKLYNYYGTVVGAVSPSVSSRMGTITRPLHPTEQEVSNFPGGWATSVSAGPFGVTRSSNGMVAYEAGLPPSGFGTAETYGTPLN